MDAKRLCGSLMVVLPSSPFFIHFVGEPQALCWQPPLPPHLVLGPKPCRLPALCPHNPENWSVCRGPVWWTPVARRGVLPPFPSAPLLLSELMVTGQSRRTWGLVRSGGEVMHSTPRRHSSHKERGQPAGLLGAPSPFHFGPRPGCRPRCKNHAWNDRVMAGAPFYTQNMFFIIWKEGKGS